MARSNEPIVWSLFAAGGMIAALCLPVTVALIGFAVPLGWLDAQGLWDVTHHPLGRLFLFALIALPLFHAAHRLRFTLVDLGLRGASHALAVLFYGGAAIGSLAAGYLLVTL